MKKINIIGNPLGTSGYSIHTKYLANTLKDAGYDVRIDTNLPQGWERQVTDNELSMITKKYDEDCTSIFIGQPQFWRYALANNPKHFVGYLVWEGTKIPEYWLEHLLDEKVDQIWVPSNHVRDAIHNTCDDFMVLRGKEIKDKIKIVPHGVDLTVFNENKRKMTYKPFTFLCVKGWKGGTEDRGGVQYVLKAFSEAFKVEDDVRLIIKLNPAYLSPSFDLRKEIQNLGISKELLGKVMFNQGNINYDDLHKLYNEGDVYVCATRAEGFNLPGIEAKAMGLTNIQTNFGGQTDYMDENDKYINYKLEESKEMEYEGILWATPDVEHLKELM